MEQWILKANGNVVPRCTTRPLNVSELSSETETMKRNVFNKFITACWSTSVPAKPPDDDDEYPDTHPEDVEEDPFE